jgi:hypothetical protein
LRFYQQSRQHGRDFQPIRRWFGFLRREFRFVRGKFRVIQQRLDNVNTNWNARAERFR